MVRSRQKQWLLRYSDLDEYEVNGLLRRSKANHKRLVNVNRGEDTRTTYYYVSDRA